MHTIVLRSKPRKGTSGNTFSIDVLGDSEIKDDVRAAIRALDHHPAKVARRSLIDMLSIIEQFRLNIRFTEHYFDEDGLENWLFVLQG